MIIRVEGVNYTGFTQIAMDTSLDDLCDVFSLSIAHNDADPLPFKGGEPCEILVDGELMLTGYIEVLDISGDSMNHTTTISGRDRTCDLLDSKIEKMSDLQGTLQLEDICVKVFDNIGLTMTVTTDLNDFPYRLSPFEEFKDLQSPENGDGGYEFLEGLALKRQVLLRGTPDGNLSIGATEGVKTPGAYIQHRVGDPGGNNNVVRYSTSIDTTNLYNEYMAVSQFNIVAAFDFDWLAPDAWVNRDGVSAKDQNVRKGRRYITELSNVMDPKELSDRAHWERDIRRARSRVASFVLDSHKHQGGGLWRVGQLVPVQSDYTGHDELMIIDKLIYNLDDNAQGGGRTTTVGLIDRDTYSLKQSEPSNENAFLV